MELSDNDDGSVVNADDMEGEGGEGHSDDEIMQEGEGGEEEGEEAVDADADASNAAKFFDWVRTADVSQLLDDAPADIITDEVLLATLRHETRTWFPQPPLEPRDVYDHVLQNYGLEHHTMTFDDLQMKVARRVFDLGHLMRIMNERDFISYDDAEGMRRKSQFQSLFEANTRGKRVVLECNHYCATTNPDRNAMRGGEIEVTHFQFCSPEDLCPHQNLMLHVLNLLRQRGLRKFGEDCYRPVELKCDGVNVNSHAWEKTMSLKDFIYTHVTKEIDFQQWKNLTVMKHNCDYVVAMILESIQSDFEELVPNRNLYACRDGLYDKRHCFFPFRHRDVWPAIANDCTARWRSMGFEHIVVSPPGAADSAVMFIDENFEDVWGSLDLLTVDRQIIMDTMDFTDYDKILDDQELDPLTKFWLTGLLGSCLEEKGEYDKWQVMVVLKGGAATGKSTIINLVQTLFPASKIGTISSSSEEVFGLESLYDKWLVVWPEAREKQGIAQHDLHSMITGPPEKVQVRRKCKTAITVEWKPPILVGTNVFVKYEGSRGAMERRMAVFPFDRVVQKGDTELPRRLNKNRMRFLVLINVMYKSLFREFHGCTLWDEKTDHDPAKRIVGQRMYEAHEEARKDLDIMFKFLTECQVLERDPSYHMEKSMFVNLFTEWKNDSGYRSNHWTFKQDNLSCFHNFGLRYDPAFRDGVRAPFEAIVGCRPRAED